MGRPDTLKTASKPGYRTQERIWKSITKDPNEYQRTSAMSVAKPLLLSLWTGCIVSTLCLCISGPVTAKRSPESAPPTPVLKYRVVDLGRHRFENQPPIPKDVAALLLRRGVAGFSLADTNARGERIFNRDYPSCGYVSYGRTQRPLRPLPDFHQCAAIGINDKGDVVGASWDDDSNYTAVLWRHGRVYDLSRYCIGDWGRSHGPSPFGRAVAINNKGQIVAMSIEDVPNGGYFLLAPVPEAQTLRRR